MALGVGMISASGTDTDTVRAEADSLGTAVVLGMYSPTSLKGMILSAMSEHGPLSVQDLLEEVSTVRVVGINSIRAASSELRRDSLIEVVGYRRDEDGGRLYPRALYGLAQPQETPLPAKQTRPLGPLSRTEYNRRYRHRAKASANSVFALSVKWNDKRAPGFWCGGNRKEKE